MKQKKNYTFRLATEDDHDQVLEFIRQHYYPEEPITIGYTTKQQTREDEEFSMSNLKYGSTILALDNNSSNQLVGVLISGPINPEDVEVMMHQVTTSKDKKWSDILRLLTYLEQQSNVCQRYNVPESLHVHIIGVSPVARGHSLGRLLMEKCMNVGQEKGYKLISIDCTSVYSIKLAEQLDMDCVNIFEFENYKDTKGVQIFRPPSPHKYIKSFAKRL